MKRSEFIGRITAALDLSDAIEGSPPKGEIAAVHAEEAGVLWDPEEGPRPGRVSVISYQPSGRMLLVDEGKRYTLGTTEDQTRRHRLAAACNNAVVRLLEDTAPTGAGYAQGSWNEKTNSTLRKYVAEELEKLDA